MPMTSQVETNGAQPVTPLAEMSVDEKFALCAWLIAELQYRNLRLATIVAAQVAQQMQPQVQQSVLTSLMG
jgi:hypothetical protein